MEIGIMGSGEIVSGMLAMMRQTGTFHCTSLFCRKQSYERGAALAEKYEIAGLYHDQEVFFCGILRLVLASFIVHADM